MYGITQGNVATSKLVYVIGLTDQYHQNTGISGICWI